jgi:non-ribosomal peptide synthetase component F
MAAYYLEARCRLLDIAAILDRIGRGADADIVADDPRMARLRQGLQAILDLPAGRAEEVQRIFSLPYDPAWPIPQPK